jgi:hypothetical protein
MKTVAEIRRENLRACANKLGGVNYLAQAVEKSYAQISQWINASKDSKTKKPRGLSDDSARYLEKKLGKPRGWLDADHQFSITSQSPTDTLGIASPSADYVISPQWAKSDVLACLQAIEAILSAFDITWQTQAHPELRSSVLAQVLDCAYESQPPAPAWEDRDYLLGLLQAEQTQLTKNINSL